MNAPTFDGSQCTHCKRTLRYRSTGLCVGCFTKFMHDPAGFARATALWEAIQAEYRRLDIPSRQPRRLADMADILAKLRQRPTPQPRKGTAS